MESLLIKNKRTVVIVICISVAYYSLLPALLIHKRKADSENSTVQVLKFDVQRSTTNDADSQTEKLRPDGLALALPTRKPGLAWLARNI